ncbi:MAG: carbohydrate kinase family protein [Anaerolineae bacterium]|nr:carbohydrate kinase family protein [Anaerolineae bacterium]
MTVTVIERRDFDVLVVGDLNADLILTGDVVPQFGQVEKLLQDANLTIGGSAAIFACGAAKLGLRVAFSGVVGADEFGSFLVRSLTDRGIDTSGVIVDPALKTGLTVILSTGSDRAMLTYLGTIAALRYQQIDPKLLSRARHLHIGSYYLLDALRPEAARLYANAQSLGLTTSLDTNYDPTEQWQGYITDILKHTDIFLPNETELQGIAHLSGVKAALAKVAEQANMVVVKQGADGATLRKGATVLHTDSIPVQVVDAVGAGDTFDAGFIYGFLRGYDLQHCLRLGSICGALSTQQAGGTGGQPTIDEVRQYVGAEFPA